jgi:hypothetical protein
VKGYFSKVKEVFSMEDSSKKKSPRFYTGITVWVKQVDLGESFFYNFACLFFLKIFYPPHHFEFGMEAFGYIFLGC